MIDWQARRDTAGVSILLKVAQEQGIPLEDCLASTNILPDFLDDPLASISVWQELSLIRNLQEIRNTEEALGLMVACHCNAQTLGVFGQAMATADNLQHAVRLIDRYQLMRLSFSDFEFTFEHDIIKMTLNDLELPEDCQRFCEERGLGSCITLFSDLLGQPVSAHQVKMRLPEPEHPEVYHDFFGIEVEFGHPICEISFQQGLGNTQLPRANRKLHLANIRYCDETYEKLTRKSSFKDKVLDVLEKNNFAIGFDEIARHFSMSSRQLRRHLTEESTNYRELKLGTMFKRGELLLRSGESVTKVAELLGYGSQESFSRAFKKYTGKTPRQIR